MPGFGHSGVGNPTSLTDVYPTSDSASRSSDRPVHPSPTRFPWPFLPSTPISPDVANAFSRPLTTSLSSQTTTSGPSSPSTSSVGHVDPSSISSSVTSIASVTTTFTIVTNELPLAGPTFPNTVGGTKTGTESVSTSVPIVTMPPNAPSVNTQTTQPGSNLLTTITSGSLVPIPTAKSSVLPNSSSTFNSLLPSILAPVLGVLVIIALGITVSRCRARRRSENMSNTLSSGSEISRERKDWMMIEETPQVNAVTLGQRITSYRRSSTYSPEHVITRLSHAGMSSQNSNGQFSDPFVDSSEIVPSRTSLHPASIHSVDTVSTNLGYTVSVNADARVVGEFGSSIDASSSSLGLHFVAPLTTNDLSTRSPHFSPSWHYDGQSLASSPREREHWDEEQQGEISPVSLQTPASPKSFTLGMGSARLRLHALLEEARKI